MADYKHAIAKILRTEGGYVNDTDDAGGETYKGIARNFWPNWAGWKIIDSVKTKGWPSGNDKFDNDVKSHILLKILVLQDMVVAFYKSNFWDKVGGDQIASQTIADNLVDSAVNEGIKPAVKRAQMIVGLAQTGVVTPELVTRLNELV